MGGLSHAGRYLLIGGGCALLANGVIIGLDVLGVHYAPASLAAFIGSGTAGYVGHSLWSFRAPIGWRSYGRFMLGLAGGALWSFALLSLGVSVLGMPVALAAPGATVLVTIWNYLAARWAIVGRQRRATSLRQTS